MPRDAVGGQPFYARKLGPVPIWVVGLGGITAAVWWYRRKQGATNVTASTAGAVPTDTTGTDYGAGGYYPGYGSYGAPAGVDGGAVSGGSAWQPYPNGAVTPPATHPAAAITGQTRLKSWTNLSGLAALWGVPVSSLDYRTASGATGTGRANLPGGPGTFVWTTAKR